MRALVASIACAVVLLAAATFARAERPPAPHGPDVEAQAAYRKGDLGTARGLWIAALEEDGGPSSSAERARILYNLGNTAFRAGQTLEAVGWYSASLRLRPRDGDTWRNLEHARSEAELEPADRGDLSATARRVFTSLTLSESEWLALSVAAAWGAVLTLEALRGGRVWRRIAFVGGFCVLVSLVPWTFNLARENEDPLLVVQSEKLGLHSEPRGDAALIAEATPGEEMERLDTLPDWTKVKLADGVEGWVQSRAVFALKR